MSIKPCMLIFHHSIVICEFILSSISLFLSEINNYLLTCTLRFPLMEQALYIFIKRHGMKGKQSNVGGLNVEQSNLLKNFIQMKILKLLISTFRDLTTVSKFHFAEKRIVHKKIHKV